MSDPRIHLLDRLNDRLEVLLNRLEESGAGAQGDDALLSAWARCTDAFEILQPLFEGDADDYPEEVRTRVQKALRLHAVAASLAQRSREEVENGLGSLADVLKRIRAAAATSAIGDSCDIQG